MDPISDSTPRYLRISLYHHQFEINNIHINLRTMTAADIEATLSQAIAQLESESTLRKVRF
jgi:hypothetical protein